MCSLLLSSQLIHFYLIVMFRVVVEHFHLHISDLHSDIFTVAFSFFSFPARKIWYLTKVLFSSSQQQKVELNLFLLSIQPFYLRQLTLVLSSLFLEVLLT